MNDTEEQAEAAPTWWLLVQDFCDLVVQVFYMAALAVCMCVGWFDPGGHHLF